MPRFLDARLHVACGTLADAGRADALLIEGEAAAPDGHATARFILPPADALPAGAFPAGALPAGAHPAACPCCVPRGPAAAALAALFLARARGGTQWFDRVLAVTATERGRAAVAAALSEDPLVSARFRAAPPLAQTLAQPLAGVRQSRP